VLKEQPLILGKITVNMANAITPHNPKGQLKHINEPIGFYIGEKDEMFNVDKVMVFGNLTTNKNSIVKVIPNKKHLSILIDIGNNIGKAINTWEK
jgi:acylglycerol lipase